jgi:leader peptidase (prepilin peptidase)/N-methyltransferase
VELLTGLMFAGAAFFIPDLAPRISFIILTANLIVILFADLETYIIPDELVLFGLSWAGITAFYNGELVLGLISAAVGAGFLFAVRVFGQMVYKKEALGFGDVKLGAMMGLYLGIPGIINGLFIGYILGALISLVLIVLKLKKSTDLIPFGPFLVAGTFLVMLNPQLWQRLLLPWW